MRKSIRLRLQVWYAVVLVVVVGGFAGILYYQVRAARMREVKSALEAAGHYLDVELRRFPPPMLLGDAPRRSGKPPPMREAPVLRRPGSGEERDPRFDFNGDGPRRDLPPGPPSEEHLLNELGLPDQTRPLAIPTPSAPHYFAIWRADGSMLKAWNVPPELEAWDPEILTASPEPRLRQRAEFSEVTMRGPMKTGILVGKSI